MHLETPCCDRNTALADRICTTGRAEPCGRTCMVPCNAEGVCGRRLGEATTLQKNQQMLQMRQLIMGCCALSAVPSPHVPFRKRQAACCLIATRCLRCRGVHFVYYKKFAHQTSAKKCEEHGLP